MNNKFVRSKQENGSYCGPAVMQMLLSAIGVALEQTALANAYGSKDLIMKEGIPLLGLAKTIKKMFPEIEVWQKDKTTVGELKKIVDAGYLVGFDWQGIFQGDEYRDDQHDGKLAEWWKKFKGVPELKGDQGHYCIALEIDLEKGYLRFADPYGHYAGKDRFVALWEFEERWWDDRIDTDERGKQTYVLEERLVFVITQKDDLKPEEVGMERI